MDHIKTETEKLTANEPEKLPTSTFAKDRFISKEEVATSIVEETTSTVKDTTSTVKDTTSKVEDTTSTVKDNTSKVEGTVPKVCNDSDSEKEAGEKLLDLAFVMDCTGSMGLQINAAKDVGHSDVRHTWWFLRLRDGHG